MVITSDALLSEALARTNEEAAGELLGLGYPIWLLQEPYYIMDIALHSIYGDESVQLHTSTESSPILRYDMIVACVFLGTLSVAEYSNLSGSLESPFSDVTLKICVSLPPSYPNNTPPQFQLLSRYIGPYGVDTELFATVTRTFISSTGVEWKDGQVVIFEGLEHVRGLISRVSLHLLWRFWEYKFMPPQWYSNRASEDKVNNILRDDHNPPLSQIVVSSEAMPTSYSDQPSILTEISDIQMTQSEVIRDRGSSFVARAFKITHPIQVSKMDKFQL